MIETIVILVLCAIATVSIVINFNLSKQLDAHEDAVEEADAYVQEMEGWISKFKGRAEDAYLQMKAIDRKGAFESDDEVGTTFKEIKALVDDLKGLTE